MAIATLSIDINAQIANLQAGLDKAGRLAEKELAKITSNMDKLSSVAGALGGALGGAFAAGSIVGFVRNTATAIDALNDAADATGSTIENLSGLEQVALRTGGTLDDVTGVLVKFNGVLKEADGKNGVSQALKAIGLDAAELRKLDPSDALQRTATALAGFADDGNKARLVQELFGKSIREAAPLLKDLAEAGKINATVTKEQAEEAEKFNKNLALLSTNSANLARSLTSRLLPAINDFLVSFSALPQAFGSTSEGILQFALNPSQFTDAAKGVQFYTERLADLRKEQERVAAGTGVGFIDRQNAAAKQPGIDTAQKFLNYYQRIVDANGKLGTTGAEPQPDPPPKRKIPDLFGGAAKELKFRLTGADLLAKELGGSLEKLLGKDGPLGEPDTVLSTNDALAGFNDQMARLSDLLGNTRTAKLEKERADMVLLAQAYEEGRLGLVGSAEAIALYTEAAQTRLGTLPAEVKPALDEMTELTKEFQRNVQDILGDGIESILKGDFDNIGNAFGNMLRKMAAQAIAADIGNLILGKLGTNGVRSGGLITSIMSLFGFANGGAFMGGVQKFATGGIVGSPTLFGMAGGRMGLMGEAGPEAIMPLKRGRDGRLGVSGGGGTTINNYHVAAGVTRNELVTALQMMAQTVTGQTDAKLRRAGIQ